MSMRLDSRVALITGGGSGLGRECALLFAEEGARVVVFDRVEKRAKDAAELVVGKGGEAIAVVGDVGVESDIARAVDTAVDSFGKLDIMFANAGIMQSDFGRGISFDETAAEVWNEILSTNLTGVLWSLKHAVRVMKDRGGAIVVTGSAAALRAYPNLALYSATKGGVNGLALAVSRDVGRFGIRINVLNPSGGMSPNLILPPDAPVVGMSIEEAAGDKWDPITAAGPLKLSTPPRLRDNANAVLFMVSDEARWMTGKSMTPADGGVLNSIAMNFSDDWTTDLVADIP